MVTECASLLHQELNSYDDLINAFRGLKLLLIQGKKIGGTLTDSPRPVIRIVFEEVVVLSH